MLIKEYHIPLPLTLEEYRIAQLYMIQKKSREESEGEGSAVEIIENHPYTDGPNGSGQYTYKIYHIGRHLPGWVRSIAPKTALEVHEEAWNAYPYTKTIFRVPFMEKFSLEVETIFEQDGGVQENIFKLNGAELRQRELDVIDIVNDHLSSSDYKKEEDPSLYVSKKNGRGPLQENWITSPPGGIIMCSYKLIKVEFRYWGLQSKIERFVHDYGLRRVMLRAHRQAWAWQDEWVGLTMTDIRRLERETQLILQKKLGRPGPIEEEEEEGAEDTDQFPEENSTESPPKPADADSKGTALGTAVPISNGTKETTSVRTSASNLASRRWTDGEVKTGAAPPTTGSHRSSLDSQSPTDHWERRRSSRRAKRKSFHGRQVSGDLREDQAIAGEIPRVSSGLFPPQNRRVESDEESMYTARPESWALDHISIDSDSDLEFFDAKEEVSENEYSDTDKEDVAITPYPSTLVLDGGSLQDLSGFSGDEQELLAAVANSTPQELCRDAKPEPVRTADILFLIIHGGPPLTDKTDQVGKKIDFRNISENIHSIVDVHFPSAKGRIALRMVPCPNICASALQLLCNLNPTPVSKMEWGVGLLPFINGISDHSRQSASHTLNRDPPHEREALCYGIIPIGVIPLLATNCYTYSDILRSISVAANTVFQEFLQSEEGQNFNGQVCLLTDCMGSVAAYDILASTPSTSRSQSPTPSPPPPTHFPKSSHPLSHSRLQPHSGSISLPTRNKASVSTFMEDARSYSRDPPTPFHSPLEDSKQSSLGSLSSSTNSLNSTTLVLPTAEEPKDVGFDFEVSHFFAFGSPLGLVLANRRANNRKMCKMPPLKPLCSSFHNLFYGADPLASRIEPLLDDRFAKVEPFAVPRYRFFPRGRGGVHSNSLREVVAKHPYLFGSGSLLIPEAGLSKKKSVSSQCLTTLSDTEPVHLEDLKPFSVWWSASRIDYVLEAPKISEFNEYLPVQAYAHIIHSRYWEAKQLVSFILRQVLHHDTARLCIKQTSDGKALTPFVPPDRVVQWNRKSTSVKRMSSNHRATDTVAVESGPQPTIVAKFQYGTLGMVSLVKEMVDVYILLQLPKPKWHFIETLTTDKHGRCCFTLPDDRQLMPGLYPITFLVKGDHTTVDCNLFILPPHTEAIVFSVDGALASNFSISAKDIKVKPGAVEVARCWQELGYLIIYITGRPDIQKDYVLSFLGDHGFPLGLVSCADSLSTDAHVKTLYLARLIKEAKMIIHTAYGSQRHLAVYKELGLQPDQIFIHGKKPSKKPMQDCQFLTEGFGSHLGELKSSPPRRAMFDMKSLLGDICFALPGNQKPEGSRKKSRNSSSSSTPKSKHSPKSTLNRRSLPDSTVETTV